MLDFMTDLHFLHPQWLWGLLPCAVLELLLQRSAGSQSDWRKVINPRLYEHLRQVTGSRSRIQPRHLLVAIMTLGVIAMAGPSGSREVPESLDQQSAMIFVLDNSLSMYSTDIAPTRVERARQKIAGLQALRPSAKSALVTYADTAHTVVPLTDDPAFFELYLHSLEPALLPNKQSSDGDNLQAALDQAAALLPGLLPDLRLDLEIPATVVLLADSLSPQDQGLIPAFTEQHNTPVLVLAMGTEAGGELKLPKGFEVKQPVKTEMPVAEFVTLQNDSGSVTGVTVDDEDLAWLNRRINSTTQQLHNDNTDLQWHNSGYWLVWVLIPLLLLWFRKGWTLYSMLVAGSLSMSLSLTPAPAQADFIDLWLTPDQQGQLAFDQAEYEQAAGHYQDRVWQGVAWYRAGRYADAEKVFRSLAEQPEPGDPVTVTRNMSRAAFMQGNSLSQQKHWEKARDAYQQALKLEPVFPEAQQNLTLVEEIIVKLEEKRRGRREGQQEQAHFNADEVREDKQHDEGVEVEMSQSAATLAPEAWLNGLQVTPRLFLQNRFASEASVKDEAAKDGAVKDRAVKKGYSHE